MELVSSTAASIVFEILLSYQPITLAGCCGILYTANPSGMICRSCSDLSNSRKRGPKKVPPEELQATAGSLFSTTTKDSTDRNVAASTTGGSDAATPDEFLQVVFNIPVDGPFTYRQPEAKEKR